MMTAPIVTRTMTSSFLLVVPALLSTSTLALMLPSPFLSQSRRMTWCRPLAYKDENIHDDEDAPRTTRRARGLTIPVIGPIPGNAPLLMGGEMTLDPPTPLQWTALEESVVLHREQYKLKEEQNVTVTAIDAAPLVAIIDDVSGVIPAKLAGDGGSTGRYATLAAVVGISSSQKTENKLDMSDESSFMESVMRMGRNQDDTVVLPLNSRIRLVGVGRAALVDFFYKLPTELEENEETNVEDHYTDDEEDEDDDDDDDANVPIVMAEFEMLTDHPISSDADANKIGNKGVRSKQMSPVHALNELSRLSNRVMYLHDARRRLVAGLTAAKARLRLSSSKSNTEEYDDDLEDYDGLGLLGGGSGMEVEDEVEAGQATIDEFLSQFQGKHHASESSTSLAKEDTTDSEKLAAMDNYGLNYFSAFSPLLDLKAVALNLFEPYYSQSHRDSEEHELEVLSFVAFRALEGFCSPDEIAWALRCTNSVERLSRAYDLMWQHRTLLENLAEEVSDELRDCGEECTDLW